MFYVDRRSIVFAIPNNGGNSEDYEIVTCIIGKYIFAPSKHTPNISYIT